jgi:hypothetical protein
MIKKQEMLLLKDMIVQIKMTKQKHPIGLVDYLDMLNY